MNNIRKYTLFVANNLFSILTLCVAVSLLSYTFFIDETINYKNLFFTIILSLISFEILFFFFLYLSFGNNYKSIIDSNFLENNKDMDLRLNLTNHLSIIMKIVFYLIDFYLTNPILLV